MILVMIPLLVIGSNLGMAIRSILQDPIDACIHYAFSAYPSSSDLS
jgi:hypothetical protein